MILFLNTKENEEEDVARVFVETTKREIKCIYHRFRFKKRSLPSLTRRATRELLIVIQR